MSRRVRNCYRRVPPEPRQFRPLHRRLPERRAERLLIERLTVVCECERVLPRNGLPRAERRDLSQRLRKVHIPRTDALGDVSVYPY